MSEVKRWVTTMDGYPEKRISSVYVVKASDYDALKAENERLHLILCKALCRCRDSETRTPDELHAAGCAYLLTI